MRHVIEKHFYLKHYFPADVCRADKCILLLHGFPGILNSRNEDLAEYLSETLSSGVFAINYRGLGDHQGSFSFSNSLNEVQASIRYLLDDQGYKEIDLIGHSWGGFLALNVLEHFRSNNALKKLILMAPLSIIPSENILIEILKPFLTSEPSIFGNEKMESILMDLKQMRQRCDFKVRLFEYLFKENQVSIIEASRDEEVSSESISELIKMFRLKPKHIVLEDSHQFLDHRESLFSLIENTLKGGEQC